MRLDLRPVKAGLAFVALAALSACATLGETPDRDMRGACAERAATMYGMPASTLDVSGAIAAVAAGYELPGSVDKPGEGVKTFLCKFSNDRRLFDVMATTPDGE